MGASRSDGFNEVRLAAILLWGGVVFGLGTIGARYYAWQALAQSTQAAAILPTVTAGLAFLLIQARLIMRLSAGNGRVRNRILFITILLAAIYLPAIQDMMRVSPYLIAFPVIAALLQFTALFLLFTRPGADWFAVRRP